MSKSISNPSDGQKISILSDLPYNPVEHPREVCRHYISATEKEIESMRSNVGLDDLRVLFYHLCYVKLFSEPLSLP